MAIREIKLDQKCWLKLRMYSIQPKSSEFLKADLQLDSTQTIFSGGQVLGYSLLDKRFVLSEQGDIFLENRLSEQAELSKQGGIFQERS